MGKLTPEEFLRRLPPPEPRPKPPPPPEIEYDPDSPENDPPFTRWFCKNVYGIVFCLFCFLLTMHAPSVFGPIGAIIFVLSLLGFGRK